jgi:hypothetical protein
LDNCLRGTTCRWVWFGWPTCAPRCKDTPFSDCTLN